MWGKIARFYLSLALFLFFFLIGPVHLIAQSPLSINSSILSQKTVRHAQQIMKPQIPEDPQPQSSGLSRFQPSQSHLAAVPQISAGQLSIASTSGEDTAVSLLSALTGNAAFLIEVYPNQEFRYLPSSETPGEWIYIESLDNTAYYAGDFVGRDYSQVYVIDYSLNQLHALDTATGADTTIGACNPISGQVWTGASGAADGTLYASSTNDITSYLYTINIETGAATVVGQITNASTIIDLAINAEGQMYGLDISTDNLVQINPATGAGSVIGSVGFNADYAQSMDFEEVSGVLYLAAYNATTARGELRIANTGNGSSTLIGAFPDNAEVDALAFLPQSTQRLQNSGFENGWAYWSTESFPALSGTSHSGDWSVRLDGEECWVWQEVYIPGDVIDINFNYWLTGLSSDSDWDNDILCGGIWDLTRQIEYVDVCYGLTYFLHHPMEWKNRTHRLDASELASIAGKHVLVGFRLTQDWNPGYHQTSTAWVDDAALFVTRPLYDYAVHLPTIIR